MSTKRNLLHDLVAVLRYARLRRALATDEHMPPLPIHGSARMYDRVPLAQHKPTRKELNTARRESMGKFHARWSRGIE